MKKNVLFLVAITTCSLAFTACSKVEAPYVKPEEPVVPSKPDNPANPTTPKDGTLLSEAFTTTLGSFTTVTTAGAGEWKIDFKTAKASGYDNATKKTTAGTYYLVSPEIDLTNVKEAHVAFEYVFRYNKGDENQQLLITDKYDAQKATEGWTLLNQQWTEGRDWKTFTKADLDIPAAWVGKKVRIAFRYNTNAESGSTWEIKNLTVATGKATQAPAPEPQPEKPVTPENPSQPTTDKALQNGSFETWTDGKPDHWSPTSGSGNATLQQSATAHEGKSSVQVSGDDKANKRLGSNDITLEAGTYTFSVYVRGTVAGSSCRLGFVPVKDGKADSKSYNYEKGYHDNLSTSEWTLVSYTFELKQTTTLSLVVMIPKTKPAFLLDSATLVKK
jgi:carbohydrate binding domain protein